jgi:putative ABC transport system permease protein
MGDLLQDLRLGLRLLVRRPGFAAVAVATLALGIGANAALFSVVEAVLLRPLPFHEPDRLVMVWEKNVKRNRIRNSVNPANFVQWRERNQVFEGIAGFAPRDMNLGGMEEPARVKGALVTADFFGILGMGASHGRAIAEEDGKPDATPVVVISPRLWKGRFGGEASIVGREVTIEGRKQTIVGVMPESLTVPPGAEFWVPLPVTEEWRTAGGRWFVTVARLRPGVTVEGARAEMDGIAAQLEKEFPERDAGWGVTVAPLHGDLVRDVRPALLVLMGAVGLVLLIGCVNVAHLLLARALAREREIAVRISLGASRGRLVRQLTTEGLVLALLGGGAGILLASWTLEALRAAMPAELQQVARISINPVVLAFAVALSVGSALLFGLAPALQIVRPAVWKALKDGGSAGTGRERRRLARGLVVAEVALAAVLLIGAGLLVRSFERLAQVNPGFATEGVLTFEIALPDTTYGEGASQARYFTEATERLQRLPGVDAAGATSWVPFVLGSATRFALPDRPVPAPGDEPSADVRFVTPGIFEAMGIPLKQGRPFTENDTADRPTVVVINEAMARQFWPGEDPIGKRIHMGWGGLRKAEVVGIVGDVRLTSLEKTSARTIYWAQAQIPNPFMTFMVRSRRAPSSLLPDVRAELARLDRTLPLGNVQTLERVMEGALERPRFTFVLTTAFATTAAVLAGLGLFGVLAQVVAQRRPEMGLRLALGALPRDVVRLVLREGVALAAFGLALGLVMALVASRFLKSLLYETSPADPLAYAAVAVLLGGVAVLAAALPARRASRVDPVAALKYESERGEVRSVHDLDGDRRRAAGRPSAERGVAIPGPARLALTPAGRALASRKRVPHGGVRA